MFKGILIAFVVGIITLVACKKSSQKLYYYEAYDYGTKYPATGTAADSFYFVDSVQTNYTSFQGDTIDRGPDNRFYLSGSYYQRRYQHFEVFRYSR